MVFPARVSNYVLCGKRARNPRFVAFFRIRRAAWLEVSGRGALAAANSRARCVLVEGCPVLSVHGSFGLALHMGQRTDNIRRNVSFSVFIPPLFRIAGSKDVQSCLCGLEPAQNGYASKSACCPNEFLWPFSELNDSISDAFPCSWGKRSILLAGCQSWRISLRNPGAFS